MKFTRYNITSGRILDYGQRPAIYPDLMLEDPDSRMTLAQMLGLELGPGEEVIEGEWSDAQYRIVDGKPVPATPPRPPATADQVNNAARARIERRYPLWKQINLNRAGGDAAGVMNAYIDVVVAASNKLTGMTPIPADFAADQWWPPTQPSSQ